ncbi:MAG: hypothetical protein K8F26_00630 [Thiobacillus sp.]|nr:hypothetical protein [Thiobacillus sp.]
MNIRLPIVLFALMVFAQSLFLLPAAADSSVPIHSPTAVEQSATPLEACPTNLKGASLAQVTSTECCKDQKGICGCRAGKIVCCDGKPSTNPGCTCHGDEGFVE